MFRTFRQIRLIFSCIFLTVALATGAFRGSSRFAAHDRPTQLVYTGPSEQTADDYLKEGEAALEAKNLDASMKALNEAIRLEPARAESYIQRAIVHDLKKEYDQGIEDCTAAIKLEAANSHAFYIRGVCRAGKGDQEQAIGDLTTALRLDPNNADVYLHRGECYQAKKDSERAITDFGDAVRLDPAKAEAFVARGLLYEDRKEFEKASGDYAQAIVVDREDPVAYNALAWIYATCPKADLRNAKMAVEYALYACRRTDWKDFEFLDTLAAAYAEDGQFTEAIRLEKRALEAPELKSDPADVGRRQKRLKCYEAGKPFRAD